MLKLKLRIPLSFGRVKQGIAEVLHFPIKKSPKPEDANSFYTLNIAYAESIRSRLRNRVERLEASTFRVHLSMLKQLVLFIDSTPLLRSIIENLLNSKCGAQIKASEIVAETKAWIIEDEEEHVAVAYYVLKGVLASSSEKAIMTLSTKYLSGLIEARATMNFFNSYFVKTLSNYLEEHIDSRRSALVLLLRFKHRSEWFNRSELYATATAQTKNGERSLAFDLYRYLYDQGIDFFIEPSSASGEVDLIEQQIGKDRLIVEVKIFSPEDKKDKSYICRGFNQTYI